MIRERLKLPLAVAILAAGPSGPAAAQTEPIELRMGWRDCLGVFKEYAGAYVKQGGKVLSEIEKEDTRSVALTLKRELIVLRCERSGWRGSKFSIEVERL